MKTSLFVSTLLCDSRCAADFETCRATAAQRGERCVRTINRIFQGLKMVLVFGNCLIHDDVTNYKPIRGKHFSYPRNLLIAPFLDGMLRAADQDAGDRHLPSRVTGNNAMRARDIGLSTGSINAIAEGKRDALNK